MNEIQLLKRQVQQLRYISAGVSVLLLIAVVALVIGFSVKDTTAENPPETTATMLPVHPPAEGGLFSAYSIPDQLDFAGEPVPLNEFEVRERYDFEMLVTIYKNSATLLGFKRANRWFPVIEPILKKNGVPDDFKYLAVIESNLSNAISPSNAVGYWQFLEATGKQYGLEITADVDERYHVEKSTEAACTYLKSAYAKFRSWTLAAASYNMGMAGLNKQIELQGERNYYDLKLNTETSRYILRLAFTKELFGHPEKYGYALDKKVLYPILPVRTIQVSASIDSLTVFAKTQGTNYKLLKELNPWLRSTKLSNPSGKIYTFTLPAAGYDDYEGLLK